MVIDNGRMLILPKAQIEGIISDCEIIIFSMKVLFYFCSFLLI